MQLMHQGNQNKCIIYSLAMLLDLPVDRVEARLPKVNGRSHHIQEVIDYLHTDKMSLMLIEPMPAVDTIDNKVYEYKHAVVRFQAYLRMYKGLIICEYVHKPGMHCVAWDKSNIYDPNGRIAPITSSLYVIHSFYALIMI